MSERDDERAVEVILRERGLEVNDGDRRALVELVPVFRSLAERLRAVALRETGPSASADT